MASLENGVRQRPNGNETQDAMEKGNVDQEPHRAHTNDGGLAGERKQKRSLAERFHIDGHHLPRSIAEAGESNRKGIHPFKFLRICFRSSCTMSKWVNVLWPFVPVAIALHFANQSGKIYSPLSTFAFNYIAMVPTANLIGFSGQELARKLPKVFGTLLETFLGSIVEIILLMVLLVQNQNSEEDLIPVIRDAILGSILANLLLCLGACFFAGGMRQQAQQFSKDVSEVGSGLLLTAAFGLAIPRALYTGILAQEIPLKGEQAATQEADELVLRVSHTTAILLFFAFLTYVWFQMRSHHGLYDSLFEKEEEKDLDGHRDSAKDKLTLTECFIALLIGLTFVSMHAVFLVEQIKPVIAESPGMSEAFMGLILIPLVEKASEHLTAVDEAWDNQMNFALAHILGSTIQTALLNAPLVVMVGWGIGSSMDLNFSTFQVILLILSIIVVGNFIRDGESNYLEGVLCIIVYIIIAFATFNFPNLPEAAEKSGDESEGEVLRLLARGVMAAAMGS